MSFPSVIRTGFGLASNDAVIDFDRLKNILSFFMEQAIVIGAKYANAAGRDTLMSEDIRYALQYQAMNFLKNIENEDNLEEKLNKYSEADSEADSEAEEEFTRAENSDDPVVCEMNRCHDEWSSWKPTNIIETFIKNAVDQTVV